MISYHKALEIILENAAPLAPGDAVLAAAAGTTTAKAVHAPQSVPPFANSAMDGFAVRADELAGASETTPVVLGAGPMAAAGARQRRHQPGTATEIMTGAIVPAGCDAVVPIERCERTGGGRISFTEPVAAGNNIREAGEDFVQGEPILAAGALIEPHTLMGLAATGIDKLQIIAAPRVSIMTTGRELLESGLPQTDGMIRDSNGPYLQSAIEWAGAHQAGRASASDEVDSVATMLEKLAHDSHIILTTGGVSAGKFDIVPDAIKKAGGEILFHKVAIRPGKPLLFARLSSGTLIFGLPGNPIAVAACFRFFAVPAIRALQGRPEELTHAAVVDAPISKREALFFFGKAVCQADAHGQLRVRLLPGQESFKIGPLMKANCWAIVPAGVDRVDAGATIQVAPLYPTGFLQSPV